MGKGRLHAGRRADAGQQRKAGRGAGDRFGHEGADLACGDGAAALPIARHGAEVLGVDIACNLVAAAQARAAAEGLGNCRIVENEARDLSDLPDNSFDLVLSVFGAMFALRPLDAAREMVRVAYPSGRIIMANWTPGNPTVVARILALLGEYEPDSFLPPTMRGVAGNVIERFGQADIPAQSITLEPAFYDIVLDAPPARMARIITAHFGPVMRVLDFLGPSRRERTAPAARGPDRGREPR